MSHYNCFYKEPDVFTLYVANLLIKGEPALQVRVVKVEEGPLSSDTPVHYLLHEEAEWQD